MSKERTTNNFKVTVVLLALLAVLSLGLRLLFFDRIYFSFDAARDAFAAISIWQGDVAKLVGPATSIAGVDHGVLYWYFLSPFYFFSGGNIFVVKFVLILVNLLNIPLLYFFTRSLTGSKMVAFLAVFLFAVSFEAVQYARWLSNPGPALAPVLLFFSGLWLLWQKKTRGLVVAAVGLGVAIHLQFFLLYLLVLGVVAVLSFVVRRELTVRKRDLLTSLFVLGLMLSPFVVKELMFGFPATRGMVNFLTKSEGLFGFGDKVAAIPGRYLANLALSFQYNVASVSFPIAVLILTGLIFYFLRRKGRSFPVIFLLVWLFSPIIIYPLEVTGAYSLNVGDLFPLIILVAIFLEHIAGRAGRLGPLLVGSLLLVSFLSNLGLILSRNPHGDVLFSVQKDNVLSDKLALVDWVYGQAGGRPFSINTVTVPLYINTTWSYLFKYYGEKKYGYLPLWNGYPQTDRNAFGKEVLLPSPTLPERGVVIPVDHFLIMEPPQGIPKGYMPAFKKFEDERSVMVDLAVFGSHRVEKRELFSLIPFDRDKVYANLSLFE